jgi:hypothetical protein
MTKMGIYSSELKDRAYREWVSLGSYRKVASALDVPLGTVQEWGRTLDWSARRQSDFGTARDAVRLHVSGRILAQQDVYLDHLHELATSDDRESVPAKVKLDALKLLQALAGIQPEQPARVQIDVSTPAISAPTSYRVYTPEEQQAAGARLAGLPDSSEVA